MRNTVRSVLIAASVLWSAFAVADDATSPAGQWTTIDDATGKPKSVVEISVAGDQLTGKVLEVLQSDQGPHPVCKECTGERKDQPIEGMTIMWGLKRDGEEWKGGKILDPKTGKIYNCKIHLTDGGKKLEMRGFVGFSLIGRTQVWERKAATP